MVTLMAYMNMGLVLRLEARPVDGKLQQGVDQAGIQSDLQYDAESEKRGGRGGKGGRESKGADGDGWVG